MGADNSGATIAILAVYAVIIVVMIVANWKIWSKAGFAGAWSLLLIIPLVGIIAYLYFAFAEWPIHRKMNQNSGPGPV